QRVRLGPRAGELFELRATTGSDVESVQVEFDLDGDRTTLEARRRGDAAPDVDPVWGRTAPRAGEGHLTDAVSLLGAQPGRVSWAVAAPGVALRYRFRANGEHTPWFDVTPSSWP